MVVDGELMAFPCPTFRTHNGHHMVLVSLNWPDIVFSKHSVSGKFISHGDAWLFLRMFQVEAIATYELCEPFWPAGCSRRSR